ncbi:MAG TPA: hypothetical protein VJ718_03435, partial [Candidatus Binataceae bacterium]|nr:hypothetical protein [Candidatus Binataceae bacterium]
TRSAAARCRYGALREFSSDCENLELIQFQSLDSDEFFHVINRFRHSERGEEARDSSPRSASFRVTKQAYAELPQIRRRAVFLAAKAFTVL